MDFFLISSLNGLSYGLLLFLLSCGLTLIFSMMGVLNFAHASFYMLGAYIGYTVSALVGYWPAMIIAPILVGYLGALFQRVVLKRVHRFGHVPELLVTFGFSYILLELVQLLWGRNGVEFLPPPELQGPAFTLVQSAQQGMQFIWGAAPSDVCNMAQAICTPFPATRALMMGVSLLMLLALWLLLTRTRMGLVIQAALTHPHMVEALGHNVPRVFMWVFAAGTGLAALAGVIGGSTFVTEPAMAATVGSVIFVVVVVGGMGSLMGAFLASLLIGVLQTFAVAMDYSFANLLRLLALPGTSDLANLTLSQSAPILPYLLLVLILIFRPKGLMGTREG